MNSKKLLLLMSLASSSLLGMQAPEESSTDEAISTQSTLIKRAINGKRPAEADLIDHETQDETETAIKANAAPRANPCQSGNKENPTYQCKYGCKYKTTLSSAIPLHESCCPLNPAPQAKQLICNACKSAFETKAQLSRHQRTHLTSYRCKKCNWKTLYKSHFESHTCEKPRK